MPRRKTVRKSQSSSEIHELSETTAAHQVDATPRGRLIAIGVGLGVLCLAAYFQVFGFDFVLIDDDVYVSKNPFIAGGLNFANSLWAWTSVHASNWHPLTWMSHALDISFFGMNAGGHHAVNLFLHIANSILVFVVVRSLTDAVWKSAFVAAVFAIHPAHVESVAWIAERKDVLSTLFWLVSTLFYIRWTKRPQAANFFWVSVLLFGLGLVSKPMLVTMPFTLLLFDYWALERFEKWDAASLLPLVKEKLPYFVLSAASIGATLVAQGTSGAIQTMERFSFGDRLANAVMAYVKYAAMLFYPADLAVWYPFDKNIPILMVALCATALAAVSAACIWQARDRKYLLVGWLWFVGTLVPVIGIVQVGRQSMADRYTYVPYIGLTIAVVWLLAELFARVRIDRRVGAAVASIVVIGFTFLTFGQVSYWQNSETLFTRTLAVTEKNFFIEHNYCYYLQEIGRLDQAENHCLTAIEYDPTLADAYNTIGSIKLRQRKYAEARANLEKAVAVKPIYPQAYANLALAAIGENDHAGAVEYLAKGVEVDDQKFFDPQRTVELFSAVGSASMQHKSHAAAVTAYEKAAAAQPNDPELRRSLAVALNQAGRKNEAIEMLEAAVRSGAGSAELHNSLGLMYAESNRIEEAQAQFRRALQINPNFAPAQNNLRRAIGQR